MKNLTKVHEESIHKTQRNELELCKISYKNEDTGSYTSHTVVKTNPTVAIIVQKDDKIAFIRQFRPATGQWHIELPGGLQKENETFISTTAERVVKEETGLTVYDTRFIVIGDTFLAANVSNQNYRVATAKCFDKERVYLPSNKESLIDSELIWIEEDEVFDKVRCQLFKKECFYDDLFLSGHSLYALMAYMLSK